MESKSDELQSDKQGNALKPCPYCGSEALSLWRRTSEHAVLCENCGATAITVGHWNMRSTARSAGGRTITVTDAMLDVAMAFGKDGSYLGHPKVRQWRGTENGDSQEAWNRDYTAELLREILAVAPSSPQSATQRLAPPTDDEIAAYRNLFRAELDKRMDTKHPSASPSTESHAIALRAFVEKRNAVGPTTTDGERG